MAGGGFLGSYSLWWGLNTRHGSSGSQQPSKMAVELVAEPWIKRPKIKGNFAPAKRGLVKILIFESFASMFGSDSEHNPFSSEPLIADSSSPSASPTIQAGSGGWSLILKALTAFTPES